MPRLRIVLFTSVGLCVLALMAAVSIAGTRHHDHRHPVLFTQSAAGGSIKSVGDGKLVLTLRGVSPQVVWFQDRPGRRAGHMSTADLLSRWSSFGFQSDPPNAALTLLHAPDAADTIAVELLRRPRYNPVQQTVTYTVRRLRKASGQLASFEGDRDQRVSEQFGAASLFIDAADIQQVEAPTAPGADDDGDIIDTFDSGTAIALPDGSRMPISDVQLGDKVMSLDANGEPTVANVKFAQCTPLGGSFRSMVYMNYGADQVLIVTPDSVLANGQLAGQLVAGDTLVGPNGQSWRVNDVVYGTHNGYLCGIKVDGTAWYYANGLPVDGQPVS